MMRSRFLLSRLASWYLAGVFFEEAHEGLVGRPASRDEVAALASECARQGFAEVLSKVLASDAGLDAALIRYESRLSSALGYGLGADVSSDMEDMFGRSVETPLGRYIGAIQSYAATEKHWRSQVRSRADVIAASVFGLLVGKTADESDVLDAANQLSEDGSLDRLLGVLATSESLWASQVSRNAPKIVDLLHENLIGTSLPEKTKFRLQRQLERSGDLSELLESLKDTPAFRQASFSRHVPDLLGQLFRGMLQRAPTDAELTKFSKILVGVDDVGTLVAALVSSMCATEIEPTLALGMDSSEARPIATAPQLGHQQFGFNFIEEGGFYGLEDNFFWSSARSSIVVRGEVSVYLACGYLRPGQRRVVSIYDGCSTQMLVIDNHFACHEIRFSGDIPRKITFKGDGVYNPSAVGDSEDDRDLCFQLYAERPADRYLSKKPRNGGPVILFVVDDKKEIDSALPIYKRMLESQYSVLMLNSEGAIEYTRENYAAVCGYLIASANTYLKLHNAGCRGSYIYIEHGVSPVKQYTYSGHYRQYDLLLMPGSIWVNRLERLYPDLRGKCEVVGYSKLRPLHALPLEDRVKMCARLGLDPNKPVILFAPTWSGGDEQCGIFNIRHFSLSENFFTIPHDGDVPFSGQFVEAGYRVFRPGSGESISDYYHLADILVSDVSSTAIEFAFLGKPVICLAVSRIPDFEMVYLEGAERLRVPHTDRHWDFCEWSSPGNLEAVLRRLKECEVENSVLSSRADRVKDFVDCCGDDAVEKSVQAIDCFFERKRASYFPRSQFVS